MAAEECVAAYSAASTERVESPKFRVISGPSNGLAQQIRSGARADLFISADSAWIDAVGDLSQSTSPLVSNRLVVAVPTKNRKQLDALNDLANPDIERIAVAAPSVPIGNYAKQVIGHLTTEDRKSVENKLVFAKDSSALVAWLENGEVDVAIVYASDVSRSDRIRVAVDIDQGLHTPIVYSIAKLKSAGDLQSQSSEDFYQWLGSEEAVAIFEKAGFGRVPQN